MKLAGSRVAVVGPSSTGDMAWFVVRALREIGSHVTVIDTRRVVRARQPGLVGVAVERSGVGPALMAERVHSVFARSTADADLVLVIKGQHLAPEAVASVARLRPVINWYPDHPVFDQVFNRIQAYTYFCPKDSWSVGRLEDMGFQNVRLLPHASEPGLLMGHAAGNQAYDLVVLGSYYPYRARWVELAIGAGATVGWWGGRVPRSLRTRLAYHSTRPAVGREQGVAFRRGRVALNTHVPKDLSGGNQRVFDAAAAGCVQLTEDLPDTNAALGGTGLFPFTDAASFLSAVADARNGAELDRIGAAAASRILDAHTYRHRLEEIASWL